MKIQQSKIRVDMPKERSAAGGLLKIKEDPKPEKIKKHLPLVLDEPDLGAGLPFVTPKKKTASVNPAFPSRGSGKSTPLKDDYAILREAALSVQRIRTSAQQELEQIRQMRADALRYQQETATRARSEANQLILRARLATQREIEELIHKAGEEIQKMLADIRVIRITAQEELSAQRKFTDAAKLNSLSMSFKEEMEKAVSKPVRRPAVTGKTL